MGELVNTSLFNTNDGQCGKCGMDKHTEASKDCCKDVPIVIKSGDSHTFSQTVYNFNYSPIILPDPPFYTSNVNFIEEMADNVFWSHAPPSVLKKPLYIQYHNFRV
jgi:hypothetical protein